MDMLGHSLKAYETLLEDTGRPSEQLASLSQKLPYREGSVRMDYDLLRMS